MSPLPGTAGGDAQGQLDRKTIFGETTWVMYTCCGGWGVNFAKIMKPLFASEVKELCLRSSASTDLEHWEDGFCNQVTQLLCLTQQFQLPPHEKAKACVCFNKPLLDKNLGSGKWNPEKHFDETRIMEETFWLYYFICGGLGVDKTMKMDTFYAAEVKELCCRGYTSIEALGVDGVFCASVGTEACIWSECSLPPAAGNPVCVFCTWQPSKFKNQAPAQIEIM